MEDAREAGNEPPESFATMPEAAIYAYLQTVGPATTITETQRNEMADVLGRMLTLYALSDDRRKVRALSAQEIGGGAFTDGARTMVFSDGRAPIAGIAVTRTSLHAAVDAIKRKGYKASR